MSRLTVRPATEQLRLLRSKAISAEELTREHLAEIDRLNPLLTAYVDVDAEGAIAAARRADALRAQRRTGAEPPLLGLPLSIKSSISVAGRLCETGSLGSRNHRPERDAVAVARLREAGAVLLGTTNCTELLMGYETDNLLYGRTRNPWSLDRQAGGSSGGEAAAIAAGISAGGLGSDSGGSVRVPAHFTGVCALKPTAGRISPLGHTLPCVGPFETLGALGPMARSIEDVALLFGTLAAQAKPVPPPASLHGRPIAVLEQEQHPPVTGETRDAVRSAADALADRGFIVEPFRSGLFEEASRLWRTFFIRCGRILLEPSVGRDAAFSPVFQYFLDTAAQEPRLDAAELLDQWADWQRVRAALTDELAPYAAILTPVCSVPAFRHGERSWSVEGRTVECFDAMSFTQWFNVLGAPAAVVPVGRSMEGLPIGVQVASIPDRDEAVLAIAGAIDERFGYQAPTMALQR